MQYPPRTHPLTRRRFLALGGGTAAAVLSLAAASAAWAQAKWEPTKPIEIIVNAGAGGATDQLARALQVSAQKNNLAKQPFVITIKAGAGGAEGMMEAKAAKGDPHKVFIGNTSLYAIPLATNLPFNWRDLTPVCNVAMDEFCLWVHADTPYKTAKEYLDAVKAAGPNKMKMAGVGSKREDSIVTALIEKQTGTKFTYIPYKSGNECDTQLVGKHVDSSTNNPSESVSQWKAGAVRPLCVFSPTRSDYTAKVSPDGKAWSDVPTAKENGLDVEYLMLRGLFLPGGCKPEHVAYYTDLFKKVVETPEWKDYLERNSLRKTFVAGKEFMDFLEGDEKKHKQIMSEAGFLNGQG